jgi:hypothetical protein
MVRTPTALHYFFLFLFFEVTIGHVTIIIEGNRFVASVIFLEFDRGKIIGRVPGKY